MHTEKEMVSNIYFHKCVIVSYFNILQATNFGSNIKPLSDLIQERRKADGHTVLNVELVSCKTSKSSFLCVTDIE